ncbi:hypothetical protein [Paenibacillus sp. V4I7]|uniref:hypothetical protein n=1 Tax=Paenibacillus sp. V4I7 TaxID=3042307 RepID=UPI0027867FC5|nr:hypothetical protein [Paenibacillus sp. V4I7]MDQ0899424.1 hypothetical protein [Paenibacillus sp. V4I7]
MKRNTKFLSILTVIIFLLIGTNVFAHDSTNQNNSQDKKSTPLEAGTPSQLVKTEKYMKHILFSENVLDPEGRLVESNYEVWFNSNGEYRMNTLTGPFSGDYEVWDGLNLYQYTKVTNDLMVREFKNEGTDVVVPHKLFSSYTTEKIKQEVNDNKLKKRTEVKYEKIDGKNSTQVIFDKKHSIIMESSFTYDGKLLHSLKITLYEEIKNFNINLLVVEPNDAHIINMN